MPIVRMLFRTLGLLLGGLLLVAVLAEALGLIPGSGPAQDPAQRVTAAVPVALAGVLLVLPYARLGARTRALGALALGVFALVLAYLAWRCVQGFLAGDLHWAAIPASLAIQGVVAANAIILGKGKRRSPAVA